MATVTLTFFPDSPVKTRITELLHVIRFLVLSETDLTEETLDERTCTHSLVTHSSSQSSQ